MVEAAVRRALAGAAGCGSGARVGQVQRTDVPVPVFLHAQERRALAAREGLRDQVKASGVSPTMAKA